MYGFFGGFNPLTYDYESRKLARDERPWGIVSTVSVSDGDHPYETAVSHLEYNRSELVIVEAYDTKEDALAGHTRWLSTMEASVLPDELIDCQNCYMSKDLSPEHVRFPRVPVGS